MANPIGGSSSKQYLQVPSFDKLGSNRDLFKRFPEAIPPNAPDMPHTELKKAEEPTPPIQVKVIDIMDEYLEHKGIK